MTTTLRKTAHLLLDLPVGIATFTVAVALAPLVTISLLASRWMGRLERARARALLGICKGEPGDPPSGWRALTDAVGWRAFGYAVLLLPLGVTTGTVVLTGWATGATALAYPAYAPFLHKTSVTVGHLTIGGAGWQAATSLAGAALLVAMPFVVRALARLDVAVINRML